MDVWLCVCALQMYQDAATMPIWQLRSGACVHIQEGAFLPPKVTSLSPPAAAAGAPAGAGTAAAAAPAAIIAAAPVSPQQVGLGEEAREFIMQQLPLFQVSCCNGKMALAKHPVFCPPQLLLHTNSATTMA